MVGLALKRPWLAPGEPSHALTAWTGLCASSVSAERVGGVTGRVLCTW